MKVAHYTHTKEEEDYMHQSASKCIKVQQQQQQQQCGCWALLLLSLATITDNSQKAGPLFFLGYHTCFALRKFVLAWCLVRVAKLL